MKRLPPPPLEPDGIISPSGYDGLVDIGGGMLARAEDIAEARAITIPQPAFRPAPTTLEAWLKGRSAQTRRAYQADLRDFGKYLGLSEPDALAAYFAFDGPTANTYVLDYRNQMVDKKLAPATINRRLAALRSLAKVGRLTGKVVWTIDVDNVDAEQYRDTQGPGVENLKKMKGAMEGTLHEKRNRAILLLLQTNGLRRSEIAELEYPDHIDTTGVRISIMGKGRRQREWVPTTKQVLAAIASWVRERGDEPGSLFGLTGGGVYGVVRAAAKKVSVVTSPHRVRHTAITRVLDRNGGDVRMAAAFARHQDLKVTQRYDDNRKNIAADAVNLIAGDLDD